MNLVPIMIVRTGRFTWKAIGPVPGHDDSCERENCPVKGEAMHPGVLAKSHVSGHHAAQRAMRAYIRGEATERARLEAEEKGL